VWRARWIKPPHLHLRPSLLCLPSQEWKSARKWRELSTSAIWVRSVIIENIISKLTNLERLQRIHLVQLCECVSPDPQIFTFIHYQGLMPSKASNGVKKDVIHSALMAISFQHGFEKLDGGIYMQDYEQWIGKAHPTSERRPYYLGLITLETSLKMLECVLHLYMSAHKSLKIGVLECMELLWEIGRGHYFW